MANGPSKIFTWSGDGRSFWVANSAAFCQDVLPVYFKHSNYASFTRLISLYGLSAAGDEWIVVVTFTFLCPT